MGNARDVTLDIVGHDKTGAATNSAARHLDRLSRKVGKVSGEMSRKTSGIGRAFGKLGSSMKVPLLAGAAAVGGAGFAVIKLGEDVVMAAANTEQAVGGVAAVFGKHALYIEKRAKAAADKYGISALEYRNASALIGASLKNQGVSIDKLAPKSDRLVKLGADLAATYGGSATEAIEAMTSALKGEFDPLERYGVSIKQSAVSTEAFAIANVKTKKSWDNLSTTQQKAATQQALWNILMKQTKTAQGQAGREANTTTARLERLRAKFEDLKAAVGEQALPVVNYFLEKLQTLVEWMNANKGKAGKFFTDVAAAALEGFARVLSGTTTMTFGLLEAFATIGDAWNKTPMGMADPVNTAGIRAGAIAFGLQVGVMQKKLGDFADDIRDVPKIVKLKGDIKDLQQKIYDAKQKLKDKKLTKPEHTKLEADVKKWEAAIRAKKAELDRFPGQKKTRLLAEKKDLEAKVEAAKRKLTTVPKERQAKIRAEIAQAMARLARINAALANVHGKTVTITTNYVARAHTTAAGTKIAPNLAGGYGFAQADIGSGASYRTGGPQAAGAGFTANTYVTLDGRDIAAHVKTIITQATGRQSFRARSGRR